jgi:hypothetical protein
MALALSLTMICASCTAQSPGPGSRTLPAVSSVVLSPVVVPEGRLDQDARIPLKLCTDGLKEANIRLGKSREIYGAVRKKYGI